MALELGLAGKVALITGGSEGLGRATAERLAAEGAHVAICARRQGPLDQAQQEIKAATGQDVLAVSADVIVPSDLERLVSATTERFGEISILVNNAGRSAAESLLVADDASWQEDLDLKVMGAVRLIRLVVPSMRRVGGGAIVNMTTPGGKAPPAESVPTSVSRAAGIALTKAASKEFGRDGIRVNTVCIGSVKSMQIVRRAQATGQPVEELYEEVGKTVPLGRIGEAEEVADLVAFLVSDRAAYITGTSINIDGGVSAVI
ncbi:MAG: short-chain dehydrogenase [Dehalococcoidia bacterium]|nr:short-chain dehydrogenase [Dehalococcoidia bacterium]